MRPAYQVGHLASLNPAYWPQEFDEVEPDLRAGWNEDLTSKHGEWDSVRGYARSACGLDHERGRPLLSGVEEGHRESGWKVPRGAPGSGAAGQFEPALSHFLTAEAAGDRSARLYFNLGVVHYRLGRFVEARDAFARAAHDPETADLANYNQGLVAMSMDQRQEAARWFARVTVRYTDGVAWMLRRGAIGFLLFAGMVAITAGLVGTSSLAAFAFGTSAA